MPSNPTPSNLTPTTPTRIGRLLATGTLVVAAIGLAACGSSSAGSSASAGTGATTTASAATSATDADTSTSSTATDSASASATSSDTAAASGTQHTTAQLTKAVNATKIDGAKVTALSASEVAQAVSLTQSVQSQLDKLTITPSGCLDVMTKEAALGAGLATSKTPMSVGSTTSGGTSVAAVQLPVGTQDSWSDADVQKCQSITMKGNLSGIAVNSAAKLSILSVPATVATSPHGLVQVMTQNGETTTQTLAVGRVGDVFVEAERTGKATPEQMASALDAIATQVKALG